MRIQDYLWQNFIMAESGMPALPNSVGTGVAVNSGVVVAAKTVAGMLPVLPRSTLP